MGRVGLVIPTPPRSIHGGGAEREILRIGDGLARRGHDVDLVITRYTRECWGAAPDSIRIHDLDAHNIMTWVPKLVGYVRRHQPDVLLSTMYSGNLAALAVKRLFAPRLRVVVRQVNLMRQHSVRRVSLRRRVATWVLCRWMRTADAVTALNQDMADELEVEAPGSNIHIMGSPIDSEHIAERATESTDHPWLVDERDTPVAVMVVRLHHQKDVPTALTAVAQAAEERPVNLIVVGEGPELSNLEALAKRLRISDRVDFVGYRGNPYPYMAKADVFILSSMHEGLSLVLLEAMSLGTPCVSTDCPHGPREALDNGRLGRLSPVGDSAQLAQNILLTLDHPLSTREERCASVRERYSLERVIDRYEAILCLQQGGS